MKKKIDIKSIAKEAIQITDKVYLAVKKIPKKYFNKKDPNHKGLEAIEKTRFIDLLKDNDVAVINDSSIPFPSANTIHLKSSSPKIMSIEIVSDAYNDLGEPFILDKFRIFEYVLSFHHADIFGIDIRIHYELIKKKPNLEICDGKEFSPMGKYAEDLVKEISNKSNYWVTRFSSDE